MHNFSGNFWNYNSFECRCYGCVSNAGTIQIGCTYQDCN